MSNYLQMGVFMSNGVLYVFILNYCNIAKWSSVTWYVVIMCSACFRPVPVRRWSRDPEQYIFATARGKNYGPGYLRPHKAHGRPSVPGRALGGYYQVGQCGHYFGTKQLMIDNWLVDTLFSLCILALYLVCISHSYISCLKFCSVTVLSVHCTPQGGGDGL